MNIKTEARFAVNVRQVNKGTEVLKKVTVYDGSGKPIVAFAKKKGSQSFREMSFDNWKTSFTFAEVLDKFAIASADPPPSYRSFSEGSLKLSREHGRYFLLVTFFDDYGLRQSNIQNKIVKVKELMIELGYKE